MRLTLSGIEASILEFHNFAGKLQGCIRFL